MPFLLLRLFINAAALLLTSLFLRDIYIRNITAAVFASLILGTVNLVLRPILIFMTLPINFLTLGMFTLVINGLMLFITSVIVPGFEVRGVFTAIVGGFLTSAFSFIMKFFLLPGHNIHISLFY